MTGLQYKLGMIIASLLLLSGCYGYSDASFEKSTVKIAEGDAGQAVSFNLSSAAVLQQIISNPARQYSVQALSTGGSLQSVQYFNGTLTIKQGVTTIGNYAVTASVNDNTWAVTLFQTFVLAPGSYTFELILNRPNLQYVGITSFTVQQDQANAIPLTVFPIIGNTVVDTQMITELGSFKFNYAEIPGLQSFDPSLGVIVDGGDEQVFSINKTTGLTESYLNLSVGPHDIQLKLYDGPQQKGRSVPTQEAQTVVAGQNLSMDLIPVYGETVYAMTVAGSDASFDIEFPAEIVSQAGGLGNLQIPYVINGPGTGYSPVEGEITQISYDSSTDTYLGQFQITGSLFYNTIYIYISFLKQAESELIGTCTIQTGLNAAERTSLCEIPVTNSLISTGNLLGTTGITVCQPDASGDCGTLVGGANVYSLDSVNGDELLGITSSGLVDSPGYLKRDLKAGTYTLRAVSGSQFGETTFALNSLEVANVEVLLNASAPTNPSIIINGGDAYTYSQYVTLTLHAEDQLGISAYYVSANPTTPGDGDWITVSPSQTFQMTTSFQTSAGTGLKTVYAWYRNISGHRSERVQDTITVQDNTALYYSNFAFTTTANSSPFNGLDSRCLSLGANYRIADWQELKTIITQNAVVDSADFISAGGLAASTGSKVFNWWINGNDPVGAFVAYNGNEDENGEYYAISIPSNDSRDTDFGWFPNAEADIVDNGTIGLYNVATTETATVLCYLDNGFHPLLNGDFSAGLTSWDHTAGSAQVISNSLALLSYDSTGDFSRVEQHKIAVKPSTSYTVSFNAKTSIETSALTAGVIGAQVNDASYDSLPAIWNIFTDSIELSGESNNGANNYFFDIQMDLTTDATADELTLYFSFDNVGYSGQSATIDNVVLTEN